MPANCLAGINPAPQELVIQKLWDFESFCIIIMYIPAG